MHCRLQVIVFDMDDTLYPEVQFVQGGFKAAAVQLDRIVGRSTGALDVFCGILDRQGVHRVFDIGLAELGIDDDPDIMQDMVNAFRGHAPSVRPYPGIRAMLQALRENGSRLGLISDGPYDVQQSKWNALGLDVFFDWVTFTDGLGGRSTWKPNDTAFVKMEHETGFSGAAVAYVGDRPDKDFPAPDDLGWRTLRVRYQDTFHAEEPDTRPDRPTAYSVEELQQQLIDWLKPDS